MCSKLRKKGILEASHNTEESPFSMTTIPELSETLHCLLTKTADEVAKKQASSNDNAK
jgi:hypothetical protein